MATGFPLGTRLELDLNGWVDVTSYVYARNPISISRGRSGDASSTDPANARFTLDNRDDMFSMRNPRGPFFGLLRRNVACRVSLPAAVAGMDVQPENPGNPLASRATTPDAPGLKAGAVLDVRAEVDADHWVKGHLVGKYHAADGMREWVMYVSDGRLYFLWSPDGLLASRMVTYSGLRFPDYELPARRAVRIVLTSSNADGVAQVEFYTAETIAGPWSPLGVTGVWKGTAPTSVVDGTAPLEIGRVTGLVGDGLPGRVVAVEVRSDGALIASPNFGAQTPGTRAFTDAQGVPWTLGSDTEITDRDIRFYGEVSQWPQSRDIAGVDKTIDVTAYGVRRRLSYNPPRIDSPMVREFASPKRANIVAYWPMEDEDGSTAVASAFPSGPPMLFYGLPRMAAYTSWASSRPLPFMAEGQFTGPVPTYDSSTGEIGIRFFLDVTKNPASNQILMGLRTSTMRWLVDIDTQGALRVRAQSVDWNTNYYTSAWSSPVGGDPGVQRYGFLSVDFAVKQSGANVEHRLNLIDFTGGQVYNQPIPIVLSMAGTNVSGRSVGRAVEVEFGRDRALGDVAIGHVAVANRWTAFDGTTGALNTWNGETAENRIARLSREDGIPVRLVTRGAPDDYVNAHQLGDQAADTWLELLDDTAASDLGVLVESRRELGFAYRTRYSLAGQPSRLTLDYDAGEIAGDLHPVDDDQVLVNDITVKRTDGGSYRAEDRESALSVLDPPDGVGRYATEVDVSARSEDYLPSQAGFRLRAGTVDEARYPTLRVDLHSPRVSDAQAARVRRLDIGDRVDILNADAWTADAAQVVTGYVEELRVTTHTFVFNLTPAASWAVGRVDEARYDTAGSELAVPAGDGSSRDPLGSPVSRWYGDGLPAGPMTAATVGAGDTPFSVVTGGGTFAVVSSGARAPRVEMNQLSGSAAQLIRNGLGGLERYGVRARPEFSAYPVGGNGRILSVYGPGVKLGYWLDITPAGLLRLKNGSDGVTRDQSTVPVPLGVELRLDVLADAGNLTVWLYEGDAVTPLFTLSGRPDFVTADEVRWGNSNASPTWPRMWWDGFELTDPDVPLPEVLSVRTTLGPIWTQDPADFPLDVVVNGERMTVTAIAGAGAIQSFTVSRGVNGVRKAHPAGTDVRLADPAYVTL